MMVNANWTRVINQLEPEDWHAILGDAYETLRVLSGGKSICEWASCNFTEAYPPYQILSNDNNRKIIIGKLKASDAQIIATTAGLKKTGTESVYDVLRNAKFKRNSPLEKALLSYFEVEPPIKNVRVARPGEIKIDSIEYGLYDYQIQVIRKAQEIFSNGSRRLMIQMPTGSGKTRTSMYMIANEMNNHEKYTVMWLAYSRELCDQASYEFEKCWKKHGVRPVSLLNAYEDGETIPDMEIDGIVIITLQKLLRICEDDPMKLGNFSKYLDCLIFDEAHQAVADHYKMAVEMILNSDSKRIKFIGLTATPGRTWNDPEEDQKLSDFFRRNIVSIPFDGWNSPNEMLTQRGFLSKIDWRPCEYGELNLSTNELELIRVLREEDDLPQSVIKKLSLDTKRNVRIVKAVDELLSEGRKRILVFCPSIENARLLCVSLGQIASKYGGYVSELDGSTESGLRDEIIRKFRDESDEPRIICNFNLLTTGFDAPNTDAGIIARPTKSLVLFSQMVGRMIRGPNTKGGTETATIVSVVDISLPGFKDSFDNWEDVWE